MKWRVKDANYVEKDEDYRTRINETYKYYRVWSAWWSMRKDQDLVDCEQKVFELAFAIAYIKFDLR